LIAKIIIAKIGKEKIGTLARQKSEKISNN